MTKWWARLAILVACFSMLLFRGQAVAQKNSKLCQELHKALDYSEKVIASTGAESILDDSSIRESMRELKINNEILKSQINITLMLHYNCNLPRYAFTGSSYASPAIVCFLEANKRGPKIPECDMGRWKRSAPNK